MTVVDADTEATLFMDIARSVCTTKELAALVLVGRGASFPEAAAILGVHKSTVRDRFERAVRRITEDPRWETLK